MYIKPVEYDNADESIKKLYDDQINKHGRITNMKKTLLHSAPSFKTMMEWYTLRDEAAKFLSDRCINLFCYSISSENNCLICSTFFRKIIKDSGENPDSIILNEEESILMEFGSKCVKDSHNIDENLFAMLKKYYNEEQIILLTAFAGMMIATNLINNVLRVELDGYLETYTRR